MPSPTFLDTYLARRRQLETDRTAKEQFDKEMEFREAQLKQQAQFSMEELGQRQAQARQQREQQAQQFAQELDYRKQTLQQAREFDLAKMAAAGEIRAPQSMEVPLNPPGQEGPSMQGVLEKLGLPGGQGTLTEPGMKFGGQNVVFTTPVERAKQTADVEEQMLEDRRQRRLGDLDKLYKSGQIPEQMYQRSKVTMLTGQQPSQEGAEESYIFHKGAAQKAMEEGRTSDFQSHTRLAASALDWIKTARQASMPYSFLAQQGAYKTAADFLAEAGKELGLDPKTQLTKEQIQRLTELARQKALLAKTTSGAQAADTVLGLPKEAKPEADIFQMIENLQKQAEAFRQRQAGRGAPSR